MQNIDRVRNVFLNSDVSQATNSDIVSITGIKPHQQVYQLTARLVEAGFLSYTKSGREKRFFLAENKNPTQKKKETPKDTQQIQALLDIGFEAIGVWVLDGDSIKPTLTKHSASKKVLYAFVSENTVLYIGKTIRTLRQRLYGYTKPGVSQSTNIKNNKKIKDLLKQGEKVKIFVFAPKENEMTYKGISVNLAAGLEDNLIALIQPLWNDTGKV